MRLNHVSNLLHSVEKYNKKKRKEKNSWNEVTSLVNKLISRKNVDFWKKNRDCVLQYFSTGCCIEVDLTKNSWNSVTIRVCNITSSIHSRQCENYRTLVSHSLAVCTVLKSRKFTLTLFWQKFRQSNVFTKESTKKVIWRNIFSVRINFSFFHTVVCKRGLKLYFYRKSNIFPWKSTFLLKRCFHGNRFLQYFSTLYCCVHTYIFVKILISRNFTENICALNSLWQKGPDRMLKTRLNCARYVQVAPSDPKKIQHTVTAFHEFMWFDKKNPNCIEIYVPMYVPSNVFYFHEKNTCIIWIALRLISQKKCDIWLAFNLMSRNF